MASRAEWNAKYRVVDGPLPGPDPFLAEAKPYLALDAEGSCRLRGMDVASGTGRHAVQMASWGIATVAVDFSDAALRLAASRAVAAGCELTTRCLDLEDPATDFGDGTYDLVAVFNYLHRPLVPVLKRCVRLGGIVVYKTYTQEQRKFGTGPRNPAYLLRDRELLELFAGFEHLVYHEACESEATAALIARRP